MAALSGKLNFRNGGKTSEEGLDRIMTKLMGTNGVFGMADLFVKAQAVADKTVAVAVGDCIIGSLSPSASDYSYGGWLATGGNLTVTNNTSGNPRIDTIVAYIDLAVVDSTQNDNPGAFKVDIVAGTPAGSPVHPNDAAVATAIGASNPFIRVCDIAAANNFVTITNANITDVRPFMYRAEGADGYIAISATCTYVSATTFTIPGDVTAVIGKNDCIKLTQTTVKYFKVINAVAASNATTVTVAGDAASMLANAAITLPYYSKLHRPSGFPAAFTWTPVFTGYSVDPTVTNARYNIVNGHAIINIVFAGGTSSTTALTFTLPVTAAQDSSWACQYQDNGNNSTTVGRVITSSGGTLAQAFTNMLAGTWTGANGKGVRVGMTIEI